MPRGAWQDCSSSAVRCFRHGDDVLEVVFAAGDAVYDFPCSDLLFAEFLVAPSKGRFVNGVLKPHAEALGRPPTPRRFER